MTDSSPSVRNRAASPSRDTSYPTAPGAAASRNAAHVASVASEGHEPADDAVPAPRLRHSATFATVAESSSSPAPPVPGFVEALIPSTINVRSLSLAVLAVLASLVAMQWAKAVLIPIALGVMLSYALAPIVNAARRWRIPRAISAAVLLGAIVGAIGWGVWSLSDQLDALLDKLPQVTRSIRHLVQEREGPSAFDKVQRAAAEIEAVADSSAASGAPVRTGVRSAAATAAVSRTAIGTATLDVRGYLLSGTLGALSFLGQVAIVIFIALFLLSSGNSFRRKMVKLAGPRLSQKRVTVETLDEIAAQIQRYLLVQLGVSVVVGILTWLAFYAIGLQQAAVWGVVAGVTNLIPYLGAILVGAGSAIVGLVQFGTIEMAVLVGGASFAIHTVVGNLLTPWLTGRASRMSPVAVFIAVIMFGWLWGVWGLLLGVPILMVVKAVCDRVDDLRPVGELLGT